VTERWSDSGGRRCQKALRHTSVRARELAREWIGEVR
jgi:hypothetical protein